MQNPSGVRHLHDEVHAAGYFPEFILDTVERSLAGEPVTAAFVQPETTLEAERFVRHLTVMVLTPTRLLINHTDEAETRRGDHAVTSGAASTTESVPLSKITAVALTRVCSRPESYEPGQAAVEAWLQLGWGIVHRVDVSPAACEDPTCEADHGYAGDVTSDDLVVRVSAAADGQPKVQELEDFAIAIQQATRP